MDPVDSLSEKERLDVVSVLPGVLLCSLRQTVSLVGAEARPGGRGRPRKVDPFAPSILTAMAANIWARSIALSGQRVPDGSRLVRTGGRVAVEVAAVQELPEAVQKVLVEAVLRPQVLACGGEVTADWRRRARAARETGKYEPPSKDLFGAANRFHLEPEGPPAGAKRGRKRKAAAAESDDDDDDKEEEEEDGDGEDDEEESDNGGDAGGESGLESDAGGGTKEKKKGAAAGDTEKNPSSSGAVRTSVTATSDADRVESASAVPVAPKKRGRPPKSAASDKGAAATSPSPGPPRKRGRPPKAAAAAATGSSEVRAARRGDADSGSWDVLTGRVTWDPASNIPGGAWTGGRPIPQAPPPVEYAAPLPRRRVRVASENVTAGELRQALAANTAPTDEERSVTASAAALPPPPPRTTTTTTTTTSAALPAPAPQGQARAAQADGNDHEKATNNSTTPKAATTSSTSRGRAKGPGRPGGSDATRQAGEAEEERGLSVWAAANARRARHTLSVSAAAAAASREASGEVVNTDAATDAEDHSAATAPASGAATTSGLSLWAESAREERATDRARLDARLAEAERHGARRAAELGLALETAGQGQTASAGEMPAAPHQTRARSSAKHPAEQRRPLLSSSRALRKADCVFWLKGRCQWGDECRFSHEAAPERKDELCKFALRGECVKGPSCLFSHDTSQVPCKFFHVLGGCTRPSCKFSHRPLDADELAQLRHQLDGGGGGGGGGDDATDTVPSNAGAAGTGGDAIANAPAGFGSIFAATDNASNVGETALESWFMASTGSADGPRDAAQDDDAFVSDESNESRSD